MAESDTDWDGLFERIQATIREWRAENPLATLTEIEQKVDRELSAVRVEMVIDLAHEGQTQDLTVQPVGERPRCPECGEKQWQTGKGGGDW